MVVCIIVGARPNFIKVAPIIRAIARARSLGTAIEHRLVYVGTEDDPTLEPQLFDDLQMPRPDAYLGVDCESLNELTGRVMTGFDAYLNAHPADAVIVVDDLASTMAAAIVTKKRGLLLAHLVAGTRSFDINMPKEINRLVIDGLSDLLFTAGISGNSATMKEGAEQQKVFMVGNILMDALRYNYDRMRRPAVMDRLRLSGDDYLVFTLNRKVLLANSTNLRDMMAAVAANAGDLPVIAPLRAVAAAAVGDIIASDDAMQRTFHVVDAMPYLEFGYLTANARGIITDSGNVAEEATFNGVPCITLNSYTEHIETVKVGSNVLVGENAQRLGEAIGRIKAGQWKESGVPELWDGRSAERIISILTR